MKSILSAVIGATLALSAIEADAQATPGERQVSLTIETDTLASALDKWAQQSGFQIFVQDWEAAKKLSAPSLKGTFTAQGALEQLLSGTPLTYVWINDKAVSIRKKVAQTVPAALKRTSLEGQDGIHVAKFSGDGPLLAGAKLASSDAAEEAASKSEPGARRSGNIEEVEEVVVTGTHIRGVENVGSKVLIVDRAAIAASGYSTVQDVLKTLPQNFNGGVGEDTGAADSSALNLNKGTAINLRGLGADSTLVLVNGRRQAGGGLSGAFVDVSSIPTSAVERIEIVAEGASSIYGSDAVGGVVNIILRRDFSGAESALRYGGYTGNAEEWQASQLLGHAWENVHAMVGYQYQKRDALEKADFAYTASADLTRFGGSDFRPILSTNAIPGNILDPATFSPAFAIPAGQNGTALTPTDLLPSLVNYLEPSVGSDLLPKQITQAVFLSVEGEPQEGLRLFVDGRFAAREASQKSGGEGRVLAVPSTNPFFVDPFGGSSAVFVAYNFLNDLGPRKERSETDTYDAAVGGVVSLGKTWQLSVTGAYAKETTSYSSSNGVDSAGLLSALSDPDPATAFNPFGDGSANNAATLDLIRSTQLSTAKTELHTGTVIAEGPLFRIGGGAVRLAVGSEYREEMLKTTTRLTSFPDALTDSNRDIAAAFAEMTLPLVSELNSRAGLKELSLNVSGRVEDYSDFGTNTNPRLGVRWRPVDTLTLRGTWGTSFKAPRLIDLDESPTSTSPNANFAFILPVEDPQSPTGFSNALFRFGGNASLKPEEATTWTVGFDFVPVGVADLRIALTYASIDYRDRISVGGPAGNPTAILTQEALWRPLITRNPTPEQVNAICQSSVFLDFGLSCSDLPTIVDVRVRNLAEVRARMLDLEFKHDLHFPAGDLSYGVNGTYYLAFERRVTSESPEVDVVDTFSNPPALRLRGSIGWTQGAFAVDAFVNHTNSYEDNFNVPRTDIDAWTTLDLGVSYVFEPNSGFLSGTTISMNVVNVLDEEPPFVNTVGGYDTANADLYGRIWSMRVSKEW